MHVGIDEESDPAVRDPLDCGDDPLGERGELAVHHQHAVRSGQYANRAALAVERVEGAGDLVRLDLDLAEVLLRLRVDNDGDRRSEHRA